MRFMKTKAKYRDKKKEEEELKIKINKIMILRQRGINLIRYHITCIKHIQYILMCVCVCECDIVMPVYSFWKSNIRQNKKKSIKIQKVRQRERESNVVCVWQLGKMRGYKTRRQRKVKINVIKCNIFGFTI